MVESADIDTGAAAWFVRMRAPDADKVRPDFDAWREDPRNAAAYRRLEDDWRRADVLHQSELLDTFRLPPPWWRRLQLDRPRVFAPALAIFLFAIVAGLWLTRDGTSGSQPALFASRLGEIRIVTLSDGSRVTLDTDSAITASVTASARRIQLDRGRARFEVVHDAGRPFVVTAATTEITDRGTVFDVRLRGGLVDVRLLRGTVEVRSFGSNRHVAHAPPLELSEGQQTTVGGNQPQVAAPASSAGPTAWVSGMLDFNDASLADTVAEINRYNARHIVLRDPKLGSLRVTGLFQANAPAAAARNLAALFELRVQTDRQDDLILTK